MKNVTLNATSDFDKTYLSRIVAGIEKQPQNKCSE